MLILFSKFSLVAILKQNKALSRDRRDDTKCHRTMGYPWSGLGDGNPAYVLGSILTIVGIHLIVDHPAGPLNLNLCFAVSRSRKVCAFGFLDQNDHEHHCRNKGWQCNDHT